MAKLSVVIPCFNEGENLHKLIGQLSCVLAGKDIEVILVDNGSTDGSSEILDEAQSNHDFIKVLSVAENRGYGHGILRGLEVATGSILGWTHADLQTPPEDLLVALETFKKSKVKNIVVKGKRAIKNRSLTEVFLTKGMQVLVGIVLGARVDDINAQPKLFGSEFYEEHLLSGAPLDFSLDLYLLLCAERSGIEVRTFPVDFLKRQAGDAKGGGGSIMGRVKIVVRTVKFILKLRKDMPKHGLKSRL